MHLKFHLYVRISMLFTTNSLLIHTVQYCYSNITILWVLEHFERYMEHRHTPGIKKRCINQSVLSQPPRFILEHVFHPKMLLLRPKNNVKMAVKVEKLDFIKIGQSHKPIILQKIYWTILLILWFIL